MVQGGVGRKGEDLRPSVTSMNRPRSQNSKTSSELPSKLKRKLEQRISRGRNFGCTPGTPSGLASYGNSHLWYDEKASLSKSYSQPLLPASANPPVHRANTNYEQADRKRLLATAGAYTKLAEDNTWQQIGKVEAALERPATRREIVQLERRFDSAIALANQAIRRSSQPSDKLDAEPMMEQDVVSTRGKVEALFDVGFDVPRDGSEEAEAAVAKLAEHQAALTAAMFEQKWADLTMGEVEAQLMVSCLQHGRLVHKLRMQLATCFEQIRVTHARTVRDLGERNEELKSARRSNADLEARQLQLREELAAEHNEDLERAMEEAQEKYDEYEDQLEEAQQAQHRMADTLTTLNGIFRGMREDADGVNTMDLRDACTKLEQKLIEAQDELTELRPLKRQLKEVTSKASSQASEITELTETVSLLRAELDQHQALVEDLAQRESERLTASAALYCRTRACTRARPIACGSIGSVWELPPVTLA